MISTAVTNRTTNASSDDLATDRSVDVAALVCGLVTQLCSVADSTDPGSWSATEAEAVVAATTSLVNAAGYLGVVAAKRVGETGAHQRCGDRTEAHHLARVSGIGVGAARTALITLERAGSLASTRAAMARGELSGRQAAAITEAAAVDPSAEGRLLRMAKARGIGQLEEECARVRAAAAPDDEAERHRRARSERGCWTRNNRDGSAEVRYRSTVDDVAEIWSVIAAYRDRLFRDGTHDPDNPTSFAQRAADGLVDMARAAARSGGMAVAEPTLPLDGLAPERPAPTPAKVIVRIDWDALVRGYPIDGETSEIAGIGPVPVQAVRDMIASGDPFLAAVVTQGQNVHTVAHLGRQPNASQRTPLEWLNPRCRAERCDRTIGLEVDHRIDWEPTKVTLLDWLEWMCRHHHLLKTNEGWRLVPGTGIRPFVPPTDPRHPSRAGPAD